MIQAVWPCRQFCGERRVARMRMVVVVVVVEGAECRVGDGPSRWCGPVCGFVGAWEGKEGSVRVEYDNNDRCESPIKGQAASWLRLLWACWRACGVGQGEGRSTCSHDNHHPKLTHWFFISRCPSLALPFFHPPSPHPAPIDT